MTATLPTDKPVTSGQLRGCRWCPVAAGWRCRMSWDCAANYLMATSGPASFSGPAAYTPNGPYDAPESDADHDYDEYLAVWVAAVEAGEFDDIVTMQEENAPWTN